MTDRDAYWGAKVGDPVLRSPDRRAVVATAHCRRRRPRTSSHALRVRRDIIGRRYLRAMAAVEDPRWRRRRRQGLLRRPRDRPRLRRRRGGAVPGRDRRRARQPVAASDADHRRPARLRRDRRRRPAAAIASSRWGRNWAAAREASQRSRVRPRASTCAGATASAGSPSSGWKGRMSRESRGNHVASRCLAAFALGGRRQRNAKPVRRDGGSRRHATLAIEPRRLDRPRAPPRARPALRRGAGRPRAGQSSTGWRSRAPCCGRPRRVPRRLLADCREGRARRGHHASSTGRGAPDHRRRAGGRAPVVQYTTGFLPTGGLRFFYRRLPGPGSEIAGRFQTAGPAVFVGELT